MDHGQDASSRETLTPDELTVLLNRLSDRESPPTSFPTVAAVAEATGQDAEAISSLLAQIRAERQYSSLETRLVAVERANRQLRATVKTVVQDLEAARAHICDLEASLGEAVSKEPHLSEPLVAPPRAAKPGAPLANVLVSNLHGRSEHRRFDPELRNRKWDDEVSASKLARGLLLTLLCLPIGVAMIGAAGNAVMELQSVQFHSDSSAIRLR